MAISPGINERPVLLPPTRSLSDSGIYFYPLARAPRAEYEETRRLITQSPVPKLCREESLFQRTATRQQWIVQRLYYDAVNETVEHRLLTVF
jgi:hypothetical protein